MNTKEKQATEQFAQGWEARSAHKVLSDCPLTKGTEDASLWCYGWHEASRDPALISEQMGEIV